VSPGEVAHVIHELASIDFLALRCREGFHIDHGLHVHVALAVSGTRNRVELDECVGHTRATLAMVVKELELIAQRATHE
jgi:hypothetical protein